jgi:hypothetical protein
VSEERKESKKEGGPRKACKKLVSDVGDGARDGDVGQARTVEESVLAKAGNSAGDIDAGEAGADLEFTLADAVNVITHSHVSQADAAKECVIT